MKQKRGLSWLLIGLLAIVILWLGIKAVSVIGHVGHNELSRGFARGHEFGHRGGIFKARPHLFMGPMSIPALVMVFIKVFLLGTFAVVWAKGRGLLKWAGALLTGLSFMSLMTPFWGLVVMILLFLAHGRMNRLKENYGDMPVVVVDHSVTGMNMPMTSSYERGRMLDEWEKRNHKEENE
ncbi:hypothetical protein ACK8P5_03865 [Paenibacillus sp. EC2-1]|uniref:hypothetical protein n=1 Tax=Paenibacillus sp. EC2-1 TaxID=3388665 RepID=UPI003BEEE356